MTPARDIGPRAAALMRSSIVWDNHGCMPLRADDSFLPQLESYRRAGVTVASLNVGFAKTPWTQQLEVLSYMRRWIAGRPEEYRLIATANDVDACKREGKLGIVFDIEGMYPVQDNLSLVQTFYELGVRWMLVAYNSNNAAGGGCLDDDTGLTAVGRRIVDEMERVGMVLCLSHTGARTAAEALEYSRNPVIFSHSNPYGDTPQPRNVPDPLIRACARKGGVVGLSGIGPFLGASTGLVPCLLRQLRYVIDLVGPEHVGLGLDYVFDRAELGGFVAENPGLFPPGFDAAAGLPMVEPEAIARIAEGLIQNGLSDSQVRGVLGGNWLRIARQVWKPGRSS
ncbi:MAG: dipeptidase [Steroidobacteraceae bacterium]